MNFKEKMEKKSFFLLIKFEQLRDTKVTIN